MALTVAQLNRQLKSELKNIYLFYGEEHFLHQTYIDRLKGMVLQGPLSDFNYLKMEGKDARFEDFAAEVETYPQMAEKKLILLKETPFLTATEYQKEMKKILSDIPEYSVVVFVEQDLKKVKKDLLKIIESKGSVANFEKQSMADLRAWVSRTFAAQKKRMKMEDVEHLISICDRSLDRLKNECEKLVAAAGDNEIITRKNIDELVQVPLEFKIYAMSDKLLEKNAQVAYNMLNEFKISKQQPTVIISLIYSHVAALYMFAKLKDRAREYLPANRKFLARKYLQESQRHSEEKLRKIMKQCACYDDGIKGGKIEGWTALELIMANFLK